MPGSLWDLNSHARDRTHIHCIGRWILNHWTIREHPVITVFSKHITQTAQVIQGTRWESPCVFQWGLIFSIMFLCNWLLKLKGEILCLSVWLCVYVCVCVCERERGWRYPWKPLELCSCQADLGFSPHLWDLDVFCPLRVSLRLANPGRASCCLLSGRSSDQNINGDYSREKKRSERGRGLPGRKLGILVGSFHTWSGTTYLKAVCDAGGLFPGVSRASLYPLPRLFFSYFFRWLTGTYLLFPRAYQTPLTAEWPYSPVWLRQVYIYDPDILLSVTIKVKVKVAQSCLTFCDPMDYTVHEIL